MRHEGTFYVVEHVQDEKRESRCYHGLDNKTCSTGHADRSYHPDGGCGGESLHFLLFAAQEDGASTQEADTSHDVGGDTCGIVRDVKGASDVYKTICRDGGKEGRTERDESKRAHARRPLMDFALQSDERANE